jgi:hypothetical protein
MKIEAADFSDIILEFMEASRLRILKVENSNLKSKTF